MVLTKIVNTPHDITQYFIHWSARDKSVLMLAINEVNGKQDKIVSDVMLQAFFEQTQDRLVINVCPL